MPLFWKGETCASTPRGEVAREDQSGYLCTRRAKCFPLNKQCDVLSHGTSRACAHFGTDEEKCSQIAREYASGCYIIFTYLFKLE